MERLEALTEGKLLIVPFNMNDGARKKWNELKSALKNIYGYDDKLLEFLQDDNYSLLDRHPNVKGHKKIAETLFEYLKSNYLKDCSPVN